MSRFGVGEGLDAPMLSLDPEGMGKAISADAAASVISPDENTWFSNWAKTSRFVKSPEFITSGRDGWVRLRDTASLDLAALYRSGGTSKTNYRDFYAKIIPVYDQMVSDIATGLLGYAAGTQQFYRVTFRIYEYLSQVLAKLPDGSNLVSGSKGNSLATYTPRLRDGSTTGVAFKTSWGTTETQAFNQYVGTDEPKARIRKIFFRGILMLGKLASIIEKAGTTLQKRRAQFAVEMNKYLPGKIRLSWGDELSFNPSTGARVSTLNALRWSGSPLTLDKIASTEGWPKGLEFLFIDLSTPPNYEPAIDKIRSNFTVDIPRPSIAPSTTDSQGNVVESEGANLVKSSKLASIAPTVLAAMQKKEADDAAAAEAAAAAAAAAEEEARLAEEAKIASAKRSRNTLLTLAAAGIGAYLYTKA